MDQGLPTFRDHFLSIFQSAAAETARRMAADSTQGADRESSGDALVAAAAEVAAIRTANQIEAHGLDEALEALSPFGTAKICAALGAQYLEALVKGDEATAARLKGELQMGTCDPRWVSTLEEYVKYFGPFGTRADVPYVRPAQVKAKPIELKDGVRVALIGDWGTGAEPARRVLRHIADQGADVFIHLGDIYYSGTESECADNFESVVNEIFRAKSKDFPVYALSGNHDMYSGGQAYYALLKRLNKPKFRQPASFFCLRTKHWQMLAMDTGLHDYSPISVMDVLTFIEKDEEDWHRRRIEEFGGKTILLSHHQLFSAFSSIGKPVGGKPIPYNPRLLQTFKSLRAGGKPIPAWFWGHEHNLCIYESYLGLERGRCLGYGAIPVFREKDPYEPLEGITNPPALVGNTKLSVSGNVYTHGFAIVTLSADTATAEYFEDQAGKLHLVHSEQIT